MMGENEEMWRNDLSESHKMTEFISIEIHLSLIFMLFAFNVHTLLPLETLIDSQGAAIDDFSVWLSPWLWTASLFLGRARVYFACFILKIWNESIPEHAT